MDLRFYSNDKDRKFRLQLERISKDIEALDRARRVAFNPELDNSIGQKIVELKKQMEILAIEYYKENKNAGFYGCYLKETAKDNPSKVQNVIKISLRNGKRKADQISDTAEM